MSPVAGQGWVVSAALAGVSWAAALIAIHAPFLAGPGAGLCAVAALLSLAAAALTRRSNLALIAVLMVGAALIAAQVAAQEPLRVAAQELPTEGGRPLELTGVVSTKIEPTARGDLLFALSDARVQRPGASAVSGLRVAVLAPGSLRDLDALDFGALVRVHGPARTDPTRAEQLTVFADAVDVRRPPTGVFAWSAQVRADITDRARALPVPGGELLPGLAVGETSLVGEELDGQMKTTSLSHLTAVSGANCALVVALVHGSGRLLRLRRGWRLAAALGALGAFVAVVTPEPSVLRAATMATVALVALAADRPVAGRVVLALSVSVLLAGDPWLSVSLGFALSASATAALLTLAPTLGRGLSRIMPVSLASALALPLAAQLVCGPLLILIAPVVPVYGVVANLLAAPAAPVVTVVGLLACLLTNAPVLADAALWLAWIPATWIGSVARTVSALPEATVPWPPGLIGAGLLALCGGAVAIVVGVRGRGRRARVIRALGAAFLTLAVGIAVGALVDRRVVAPARVPDDAALAQCDVGQGDAVLVRSAGRTALVDTGADESALLSCLELLGVQQIDLLVLTHFDLDHVGAAGALRGRVGTVLHGPFGDDPPARALLRELESAGAVAHVAQAGQRGMLGTVRWSVLWPRAGERVFDPGNDQSVVLAVQDTAQDARVPRTLMLGDLGAAAQRALVASGAPVVGYDVVKVAHHGSADQDPSLTPATGASVALIGVGAGNDYGHPRDQTLSLLRSARMEIVRSDRAGLTTLRLRDGLLELWRARGPGAGVRNRRRPGRRRCGCPAQPAGGVGRRR